ncbi:Response regulator protein VraR [Thermoflexales bacterium]|nr:Response regulator protein VraR [Thermoflexales bacterium]
MSNPSLNHAIRILIADDHPVVRDGLRAMLSTQPDFQVVAEAINGVEAVRQAANLKPDVILLDLEMPELDGVAALQQIRSENPVACVIVLTAYDADEHIVNAVTAGAKGYLLKGALREDIFQAIRTVHEGGSLLQPIVASKLMQHLSDQAAKAEDALDLTPREIEVLRLMAQGHSNKQIATALVITERTTKFHVSSILAKLDARNRTEAVKIAAQRGLVKLTE